MSLVGRVGFPQLDTRVREILKGNSRSKGTEEERHGVYLASGVWVSVSCIWVR